MPRDANGNYTKPNPPVSAGETIQAAYENSNTDDQATELTDSLSRSGKGQMLTALKLSDPGCVFSSEETSGMYRNATGDVRLKTLDVDSLRLKGYSADIAEAQNQRDPGLPGSESLAANIEQELLSLRYAIARTSGAAYWYSRPVISPSSPDFASLGTFHEKVQSAFDAAKAAANGAVIVFNRGAEDIGAPGSITLQNASDILIYGNGVKLTKKGSKGVFSLFQCTNVHISGFEFNGDLARDEAAAGSILDSSRNSADYAFAIGFTECNDCSARDNYAYDFAWDGIFAYGAIGAGGTTATQSERVWLMNNRLKNVRGTMLFTRSLKYYWVKNNVCWNDNTFQQKANGVFSVEWCHDGVISDNRFFYIGDNAIGIGQLTNKVAEAINKRITITNNISVQNRYHTILIAQGRGVVVRNNHIREAGKKDMVGGATAVLTGGITIQGGGSEPSNFDVEVSSNIIEDAYEYGIHAFDDAATTPANSSDGIVIKDNIVRNAGQLPLASRIATRGINCQIQRSVDIRGNKIYNPAGEGMRVFGDALINHNIVFSAGEIGIHIPQDTIFNNVQLSGAISNNTASNCKRSGITISGHEYSVIEANTIINCGDDAPPGTETTEEAQAYSGIGLYNNHEVVLNHNLCKSNGAAGILFRPGSTSRNKVHGFGNVVEKNGVRFVTATYRAGFYLIGFGGNTITGTLMCSLGQPGTTQQYPIYATVAGTFVSLDERFGTHTNPSTGVIIKNTSNIP